MDEHRLKISYKGDGIMDCKRVKKDFKIVGMKNSGNFSNFASEVPQFAQKFLSRANEIDNSSETEISLFEPKKDDNHQEGHYYVGLIVNKNIEKVPPGMEYIEQAQEYVTVRGKINNVGELHTQLSKWADEQGYKRNTDSYIVETYHPVENDLEDVEIYLPIHA